MDLMDITCSIKNSIVKIRLSQEKPLFLFVNLRLFSEKKLDVSGAANDEDCRVKTWEERIFCKLPHFNGTTGRLNSRRD